MGDQHHIVQKLVFEIELAADEDAFGIQTKISDRYEKLLLQALCEIFDKLIGEEEILRIDKLEINLGEVSPQYLEYELPEKIRKEIEQSLARLIYEVRQSPEGNAEVRIETVTGEILTVQATVEPRSHSVLGTLAYLLEFGTLPWSEDRKEKPTLRSLVSVAMEKHPGQLRRVLQQLYHKPHIFRRLALQLPEEQLQYLAAILGSGFSSKLPAFLKQIKQWMQLLLNAQAQATMPGKSVTTEKLGIFFWEETLRYFSGNDESRKISTAQPEALFLSEILNKAAAYFELKITAKQIKEIKVQFDNPMEIAIQKLQEELIQIESKEKHGKQNKQAGEGEFKIIETGKKDAAAGPGDIERILKSMVDTAQLPESPELKEGGVYVGNAGLVILAAYIPRFFKHLGYVKGKEFIDEESKWKAVHMLQWLVNGDRVKDDESSELNEHDLLLNKLLCGIDIAEPVPVVVQLTEKEKEDGIELLNAVIANWPLIKRISVPAFQVTFLVKEGKLERLASGWNLFIHRDSAVDLLIDKLPWSISMILFPWNKETIFVEW